MSKKKKAGGVKLGGKYGSAYQGPKRIVREGTGQSGGVNIPRYGYPGFRMIETPDSPGMIKAHRGAELGKNGTIYYPASADVDPKRAAEAQALADYNDAKGRSPEHRKEMVKIYGDLYTKEFDRLAKLGVGQSGPSAWRK